ncbi:MAG: SUMF1/EgtB/PvdO family nonheme iron enzyme [Caldilineaceae bacterium]|nr:SUMF1/EgtB/PvdO family nonheme iron enzyme [Caldilineaceae bacterium]MBP8108202.1 SUMF1/EgtB/PvdO family nonheme iron enzyme [Caldilineaceae bacterium]MBP8124234.1 SUMF1/EgtB/PvdO family nonheme iron enzyme [Caldilineaceae bacterium]MBP9074206.1 SUMF1/EgtB/PvdO family nonheme iron enzyme [Caldilineaceae bacterium]
MKRIILSLLLISTLVAACAPTADVGAITPPRIDTGVDPAAWVTIPAGEYPSGQMSHMKAVDEYQIMVTDVTVEQYANFLNEALASGDVSVGDFEVEAGEVIRIDNGVGGYYGGEPFDGYKHEEEIKAGEHLYAPLTEDEGTRLTYDGQTFTALAAYANHPMNMVTWFGANAYCEYYSTRLPTEIEWEKAARGTEIVDEHGLPFPWGQEIAANNANYYSSFDLFEKMFGKLGNTTPVGFYNGQTYDGYETLDSASPYGLYDMAGNVWQWMGDDYADQHYRHMRGGSFYSYEVDLRVWKNNSAGPQHYAPSIGFRCAKD